MNLRPRRSAFVLGSLLLGWFGARAVVPTGPAARASCGHAHDGGELPAMSEAEYESLLAESAPWMLPLRDKRRAWVVTPGDAVAESERLWEAAATLDGTPPQAREAALEELSRELEAARLLYEREAAAGRGPGGIPSELLWSLEANWEEARARFDAFHAGRCRLLDMDELPAGLAAEPRAGLYLSGFLSPSLRRLVLLRIESDITPRLHALKTLLLEMRA